MKNYKRVLALVCAGLMGISMMGCGGDTSSKSTEAEATPDSDDKETVSADGEDETSSDKKFKIGIQMKTLDSGFCYPC